MKRKESEKEKILQSHQNESLKMDSNLSTAEENISKMEEKVLVQENKLRKLEKDLGESKKENTRLNNKIRDLIEDSERIGEQSCQVAQVEQVESAGIGYEQLIAEEQVR